MMANCGFDILNERSKLAFFPPSLPGDFKGVIFAFLRYNF